MSYLAKTLITPVLGQYTFTFPAAIATVTDVFTPVYLNGTSTFTDYCSISGNSIILQPGNYLIECYISATKSAATSYLTYKIKIDGVDAIAPKGFGYIGRLQTSVSPDGFQQDISVPENSVKTITILANSISGTITYIPAGSTMLIWRI